jgi:phosphoglycerate dehydrogenase-like enzyme
MAANPDVLLAGWKTPPLPAELPPRLRYVCYLPGSVRKLVGRAHLEGGLLVTNWGGSVSRVVAECALMLTLVCLRRAGHWMAAMRRPGVWKNARTETASLFGRRVGIHGFGLIARELTLLLRPFGVDIEVFAPESDPVLYAAHGACRAASLEGLFANNDVIIELAPLNPGTTGIVTERLLRLIPAGGVFVNVGRGAVVDEEALLRVAREGRIQVGLDVYATEPLPADSGLRVLPNVSLLPHLGGPTSDRCRDAGAFAQRNLRAYASGQELESVISPEVFDVST